LKNKENKTEMNKSKKDDEDDREVALYPKAYDIVSWFNIFKSFLGNVKEESEKVTWPTRKETTALATAVFVLTLFFSVYLGLVDFILSKLVDFLVR
jgi:preprotein translocase subunit SecE